VITLFCYLTDDDGASNSVDQHNSAKCCSHGGIPSPVDNDASAPEAVSISPADVFYSGGRQLICMVNWGDGESSQGIVTTGL
jgi:hypothetical protein